MKTLLKILLGVLFFVLFLAPVGILLIISDLEQAQYEPAPDVVLQNMTYGEPLQVERRDIAETVLLSGVVISTADEFLELGSYRDPYLLRLIIDYGQIITEGETIGYYRGEPVLAEKGGIVREISIGTDSYIRLESLANLALQVNCHDERLLSLLQTDGICLTDDDGAEYRVVEISPARDANGDICVVLSCTGKQLVYGTQYEKLSLKTGRIFSQVLVVNKICVYTPVGSDKKYVRMVAADGTYIAECEVSTGYESEDYICISGVEEGAFCDSGYKAVVERGVT